VDIYAGFKENVYGISEIKNYVDNIYIATENGLHGSKGYVTDIFNPGKYSAVLCCGPRIMMERVVKMCNDYETPVYISMENYMACGIGACLVCTCKTLNGNKRTCKDGPVFLGKDVILDA
jgi:dihydroorotate dehydrogenase electron transfer subunit